MKLPHLAVMTLLTIQEYKNEMISKVSEMCYAEITALCSIKTPSILRQTDAKQVKDLRVSHITNELKQRTPALLHVVSAVIEKEETDIITNTLCATMIHSRCKHMAAFAQKTGLLLKQCGTNCTVSKMILNTLVF